MVEAIRAWYRNRAGQPYVRPWGLAAPILVLIVCLPLLRPLRLPELTTISDNELERLATIQAIVEHRTLAIDHASILKVTERTIPTRGVDASQPLRHFSKQPPVLAALLAGPYWVMHCLGLTFDSNLALTVYLLTVLGAAIPAAVAAGLIYRMGRLFELARPWRTALAGTAVFGSGLLSYATVLNSHAPAAALVLGGFGCLFHAMTAKHRAASYGWTTLAGLTVGFAAVIDLGAVVLLILLATVVLAVRWPTASKVAGIGWYVVGALPPLLLHAALTVPISGDIRPLFLHPELSSDSIVETPVVQDLLEEDEPDSAVRLAVQRAGIGLLGPRGLLSHFPILLIGVAGAGAVLRRNWPAATKVMAMVSLGSALMIMGAYAVLKVDWEQPMFSVRWFVLFLPLIVFWAGAWLRQAHHPATWTMAGTLLAFSVLTTLLGATAPFTRTQPGEYTAYTAAKQLLKNAGPQTAVAAGQWEAVSSHDNSQ